MISVICPTVPGREHHLERCEAAYTDTTIDFEFLILRGFPTCGEAWNEGIKAAEGNFIHLTADDIEPHPGWLMAGMKALSEGVLPCPRILNTDGTLQSCGDYALETEDGTPSEVARIPLFPRSLVDVLFPVFEKMYMGDYWITWKAAQIGWKTEVRRDFLFTHHLASEGRLHTLKEDFKAFRRATA